MLLQLLKYTFVFTDDIYSIEVNIHFLLETQVHLHVHINQKSFDTLFHWIFITAVNKSS